MQTITHCQPFGIMTTNAAKMKYSDNPFISELKHNEKFLVFMSDLEIFLNPMKKLQKNSNEQ